MNTFFLNSSETCIVCFKIKEDQFELIKHHVSYFPQKIAYVHYSCHNEIHNGKHPHLIQYKEGDSRKFYALANGLTEK